MDRRILRAVQLRPGAAIAEIAEEVGLSQTPCWRRLRKLEEDGVIAGRAVLLDPGLVELPVTVFAYVKLRQHDEHTLNTFEQAALGRPEIVECYSMSGDSDYVMRVVAGSIEDYEQFLKKVLLHLPGVGAMNSSFALKRIKQTTVLPV
jgi:Lrp/AsnC family transcriptional regulator